MAKVPDPVVVAKVSERTAMGIREDLNSISRSLDTIATTSLVALLTWWFLLLLDSVGRLVTSVAYLWAVL